ncbi:hypothetical protein D9M73_294000 [compost metagenome]
MHSLGESFLARTGFAVDQQWHVPLVYAQGLAEIRLQRGIAQADARQARAFFNRGSRHQRHWNCTGLPAQHREQLASVTATQWPAGTGVDARAAEQFVQ